MNSTCTYVDGIASSQAIDTAGEVVDLNGLDCSSLIGAALNWEHKKDEPSQIVGKILQYKKIFTEQDCENDRQLYYWNKCQLPFLYILGRLFDDKKPSSVEVAALFKDDAEHPEEQDMVGFSVEGAKVHKEGMVITRSIARKVTITNIPANKTCIAEMVVNPEAKKDDGIDSIFKAESTVEIQLFKSEQVIPMAKREDPKAHASKLGIEPMKKDDGALSGGAPTSPSLMSSEMEKSMKPNLGTKIGMTQSGKHVMSHGKVGEYHNFSVQDHHDAAKQHMSAVKNTSDIKLKQHHNAKATLHTQAAKTMSIKQGKKDALTNPDKAHLTKALEAGSGNAAPSQLTQGAALTMEDVSFVRPKKKKDKDKWVTIAEREYSNWGKREEFEKFMSVRMPHLAKGEIQAIGQTLVLKKSLEAEETLDSLNKAEIHSGIHEFNGEKHHVQIHKQRSGRYTAFVSPGEKHIGAPGSTHTLHYTHKPAKNGFSVSHDTPYAHPGGTASAHSKSIREFVTAKVKEHHEK